MGIVDILIIIFILFGGVIGFKQGFTKSLINFLGLIIVIVLSFLFKNSLSLFLMKTFPFLPFDGFLKGVTVLNIVLYEVIAFSIMFSVLMIIFKIVLHVSSIFERILSFTIILGIPSKLLGFVVGIVKNYILLFFILYFLSMPNFSDIKVLNESKYKRVILKNTPVLSMISSNTLDILDEFKGLTDKYKNIDDNNQFNLETLDLFLKYKITSVDVVDSLVNDKKINIKGIDKILNKYKES